MYVVDASFKECDVDSLFFDCPFFFFFNDTATTEIYTLSLHDALPIYRGLPRRRLRQVCPPLGDLRPVRGGDVHPPDGGVRAPRALGPRGRRRDPGRRVRRSLGPPPHAGRAGRRAPRRPRSAQRACEPAVSRMARRSFLEACAASAAFPLVKGFVPMKQKPHVVVVGAGGFGGWAALYLPRRGGRGA